MTTRTPAVMDDPAIVSCLAKHATRLCRSVRHPDSGLAITCHGSKAGHGSVTQEHNLSLAVVPESQADMLDIRVSQTAGQYEGKIKEISSALLAAFRQSSDQGPSPRDQTVTFSVKTKETPIRSLAELFSEACHGSLLQEVVSYLPEKEIIRLTRTCKNVGLVVSGSSLLQLRLRKLYHGLTQGSPVLPSKAASSANQLAWLLERELRISTLRPRYYSGERRQTKGVLLQSDGGFELSKQTYFLLGPEVRFTMYQLRDTSKAVPSSARVTSAPSTAAISAKDDLYVTVHREDLEELDESQPDCDIWRFQFLRLEPSSEKTDATPPQRPGGRTHPDARLPFIDLAIHDPPHTEEGEEPELHLTWPRWPEGPAAFVLDWKRGEVRGVMKDTSDYALRLMSHALVGDRHLLSTGISKLERPDEPMRAGLWITKVPGEGRRPGRLPTLHMLENGAEDADRLYSIACDDLTRIVPEAVFWLPFISGADRASPNYVGSIYHLLNGLLSTSSVSGAKQSHDALALFTFSGYVTQGDDPTSGRPVQCSGVAPVSHLLATWKTRQDNKAAERPEKDKTPHEAECSQPKKELCSVAWDDWHAGIHVFVLNTLLPPVLHGTTVIVGYSQADEERGDHGPTIQAELGDDSLSIPLKDLKLAIRDFNVINRLSSTTQPQPWHKLGLPMAHPLQPNTEQISLPDCDDPMISHSDWTITSAPMQSTRGMFEVPTIHGGLKYNERVASLPASALKMFAAQGEPCPCKTHGLDPYWDRVSRLVYDGHSLVVETYRSDIRLAFAPLRNDHDRAAVPEEEHRSIKECRDATGKTA